MSEFTQTPHGHQGSTKLHDHAIGAKEICADTPKPETSKGLVEAFACVHGASTQNCIVGYPVLGSGLNPKR